MRPRVLYVDDDRANLISVQYALDSVFDITTAQSGTAALELFAEESFDALLVDQRMPGMTGVELCARVGEIDPTAVRLLYTAYVDADAATQAINEGGVSRVLSKPLTNDALRDVLFESIRVAGQKGQAADLRREMVTEATARAEESVEREFNQFSEALGAFHDLLWEGAAKNDPRLDGLRDEVSAFRGEVVKLGGTRLIHRVDITELTLATLHVVQRDLPCTTAVHLTAKESMMAYADRGVFAHALWLLLDGRDGLDGDIEARIQQDELQLAMRASKHSIQMARRLLAITGAEVVETASAIAIRLRVKGAGSGASTPQETPIVRAVDRTFRGQRIDADEVDVLFVDDREDNRALFEHSFSAFPKGSALRIGSGFRVAMVASAQEALAQIPTLGPVVLVTDERMPQTRGSDLCKEVQDQFPHVIRVVLTAYGDFRLAQRVAGSVRYLLHSPYSPTEVEELLLACIAAGQEARAARLDEHARCGSRSARAMVETQDRVRATMRDLVGRIRAAGVASVDRQLGAILLDIENATKPEAE